MNIGLIGYGRMGQEIEQVALKRGHHVSAIWDIEKPLTKSSDLNGSEVLIDFSYKDAVLNNLEAGAYWGVPVVEGTTGWNEELEKIEQIKGLSVVYSPNFSIGMYLFMRLVDHAAALLAPTESYDCYVHEWHHAGKADSPSGTAKKLADILLNRLPGKQQALFNTCDGKIEPQMLHVTSTRVGSVPGTHKVGFDSESDMITLQHQARGREGFAHGAIRAAEWIVNRQGIFTMDDFIDSIIKS